jgi:gas vesicle protein
MATTTPSPSTLRRTMTSRQTLVNASAERLAKMKYELSKNIMEIAKMSQDNAQMTMDKAMDNAKMTMDKMMDLSNHHEESEREIRQNIQEEDEAQSVEENKENLQAVEPSNLKCAAPSYDSDLSL